MQQTFILMMGLKDEKWNFCNQIHPYKDNSLQHLPFQFAFMHNQIKIILEKDIFSIFYLIKIKKNLF